jgi:hypothetical protein
MSFEALRIIVKLSVEDPRSSAIIADDTSIIAIRPCGGIELVSMDSMLVRTILPDHTSTIAFPTVRFEKHISIVNILTKFQVQCPMLLAPKTIQNVRCQRRFQCQPMLLSLVSQILNDLISYR